MSALKATLLLLTAGALAAAGSYHFILGLELLPAREGAGMLITGSALFLLGIYLVVHEVAADRAGKR